MFTQKNRNKWPVRRSHRGKQMPSFAWLIFQGPFLVAADIFQPVFLSFCILLPSSVCSFCYCSWWCITNVFLYLLVCRICCICECKDYPEEASQVLLDWKLRIILQVNARSVAWNGLRHMATHGDHQTGECHPRRHQANACQVFLVFIYWCQIWKKRGISRERQQEGEQQDFRLVAGVFHQTAWINRGGVCKSIGKEAEYANGQKEIRCLDPRSLRIIQ